MSRIAGFAGGAFAEPALLDRMLSACRTSGEGAFATDRVGPVGLGFWGRQPNRFRAADVHAVVDGVFFNRAELPEGASDAERLCHLFRKYGFGESLRRINGDFAVALHEPSSGALWLARDRFGVKPLYYALRKDGLVFASRPRALLALPQFPRDPNPKFVALVAGSHYRTFDNAPEESPYAAIAQLPAGGVLKFANGAVTRTSYFRLSEEPDFTDSDAALAERLRALMLDAVQIRNQVAERPAFTLSGGMDSSSVLSCTVHSSGQKQVAFSSVYEDRTYDESDDIRTILDQTVETWHRTLVASPDLIDVVSRMVEIHDEPVATATWLSHFALCEDAARKSIGSLFGGMGGDELNAGEYEYFFFFFADLEVAGQTALLERETNQWIAHHDHPIFRKTQEVMRAGLERLVDLGQPGRCLPDRQRLARWRGAVRREYYDLDGFEPVMDMPFRSYLKNRTYQDIYRETAPCCLRAADRNGTAFGIDIVWPFFDHRLVEFMFRVPGTLKIRDGITKVLLREAMRGIVPEPTRARIKKTGWNAPAHRWFIGSGRQVVLDLIGSRAFRERGIFDVDKVRSLLDEHRDIVENDRPEDNHMMFFWQLVNLELWLRSIGG